MLKNDWDEVRVENSEDSFMKEGQDDFLSVFVHEVQKIESFYLKKIEHYAEEFHMLRDSYRKYHNLENNKRNPIGGKHEKVSHVKTNAKVPINKVTPIVPVIESLDGLERAQQ